MSTETFMMQVSSTTPSPKVGGSVAISSTRYMGFLAGYNNINTQKVIHSSIQDFRSFLNSIGINQEKIDQDIINLYLNHLRGRGLRNATYNLKVSNLKKYVEYMGVRGLTYKTEPIEVYGNMDIIPERDFKAIVHYLSEMKDKPGAKSTRYLRDFVLFNLFFLTGIRKAEALSLKFSSIRVQGEGIYYSARCKGGKEITKPFPGSLFPLILLLKKKEMKQKDDHIFTADYNGKKLKLSHFSVNKKLNKYHQIVNGKTETVSVHGIRNLSAWNVYKITKDILKVKEHLNHSNLNTTYKYLAKMESKKIDYYGEMEKVLA